MEKIKYYLEKYKMITVIIILLIIVTLFIYCIISDNSNAKTEDIVIEKEEKVEENEIEKYLKIDIKGSVTNPGVYELKENLRVIDAIESAGGLLENSNTEYINLSKKLTDEMIIIIYSNEEVSKFKEVEKEIIYIKYECECPDNINEACIDDEDIVNTSGTKSKVSDALISINNATIEELMTLDGVGESKAKSIIKYREENGGFKDLEELMNVSGIGESAYSKIKDNIKL